MPAGEWIRRAGLWTADFLGGAKVRRHSLDVRSILEADGGERARAKKDKYLGDILAYATEHVEFYKPFKGATSLEAFPVVNKNILRGEYAAFQSGEYKEAKTISMHTSGSTGTPFVVRQDGDKRRRVYAEMAYLWGRAGYRIGMRYAFFRIWTDLNRRSRSSAWARNLVMVDILKQDEAYFEGVRNLLKSDRRLKMILIYPSVLNDLANYLLAKGDTPDMFHLQTILGIGEAFPEDLHQKARQLFGCEGVSLYSNQECGLMAMECPGRQEFHLNSASYRVEILKFDSDEPAETEEPGRIVVTDLFNHAMPLIRYDTGDIGTWKKSAGCGWNTPVLSSIHGKIRDFVYDTGGAKISPAAINILMWPFDHLLQFQFIQEGEKRYTLRLNEAQPRQYADQEFIQLFKGLVGQDGEICIERVDEIPVLSSGKRRTIVNHFIKVEG